MTFLNYIQLANTYKPEAAKAEAFLIGMVTNFTDDILNKVLIGICLKHNIHPHIYKVPYKQYGFELKNPLSRLWGSFRLVFFFFDINFYLQSEFSSNDDYGNALLDDLESYVSKVSCTVVVNTFLLPYRGPRGNHVIKHALFDRAQRFNNRLWDMAAKYSNLEIFDINRLVYLRGERAVRDLRGLYAFDTPFTNDFLAEIAEEWFAYILTLGGKAKKVIVLDLDNTLWGGVVGELGPSEIELGPGYPGMAFQNFQRALLEYQKAGILLAINSKNNLADVEEVFEKNGHMVLQKHHFSAIFANWEDKASNLQAMARQLNLGLESFVFFDDDPLQRELVNKRLPEVLVPELGTEPETYAAILFDLPVFSPFALTEEDLRKNQQYQQEQQRQVLQKHASSLADFIAELKIEVEVSANDSRQIPRLSQLTLKTNQFNLTTRRYAQKDISRFIENGLVFGARVKDKYGDYGLTALAIILPDPAEDDDFVLDSFLMSCRILGRGVEFSFLDFIIREFVALRGVKKLRAQFIPSNKNEPAKNFLNEFGFQKTGGENSGELELDVAAYCLNENPKVYKSININAV